MTTFLFSLAALGAAFWLRHGIAARPKALARIRRQRGNFRSANS
jgi:hypothetical protein